MTCLLNALKSFETLLSKVIFKHDFWISNKEKVENENQYLVLNMLLDGFDGKLATVKWAKIGKCSHDTALRDIQSLFDKNILRKLHLRGRSTSYGLFEEA